jgi:hypothetical protein
MYAGCNGRASGAKALCGFARIYVRAEALIYQPDLPAPPAGPDSKPCPFTLTDCDEARRLSCGRYTRTLRRC